MAAPKKKAPKNKGGRPTLFRDEFIEQTRKLCRLGATEYEVAEFFKVSAETIRRWKHLNEEFCGSLKAGTFTADDRTQMSLYHRANGYNFESEKIFCQNGKVTRVKVIEHVPPDTTAMIFWLKNRRPKEWRDRQENVNFDVHLSLADLVNQSYEDPKLVEGKEVKDD